jgi:hypothetical protein
MKSWGKGKVRRLLGGGAGLIFKGSGFYITDYRSEGYKSAAKKESGDSGGGKTESAAASKAEAKSSSTGGSSDSKTSGKTKGSKKD